jgi:hypothetical protein
MITKVRATNPPAKFASVEHAQRAIRRHARWHNSKGRRSPKPPFHIAAIEHPDWRRAEEAWNFIPGRVDKLNRSEASH